jgi:hypothetical protein
MNVLFTGTANLHGLPIVQIMLKRGDAADAIENLNDGFDAKFKPTRLKQLKPYLNFKFMRNHIGSRPASQMTALLVLRMGFNSNSIGCRIGGRPNQELV